MACLGRLSKREKSFVRWYCATLNPREAAVKAGFGEGAEEKGLELLRKPRISAEIKRELELEQETVKVKAVRGLMRAAFGSSADIVKLLCCEDVRLLSVEAIEGLDLFLISEIKRPRDGSMEIKLADRLKAMERLLSLDESAQPQAAPLYRALAEAAASAKLGGDDDGD